MENTQKNRGSIFDHWQTLAGIISFVFFTGVFYSETNVTTQKIAGQEERFDRQFQLYNDLNKRLSELEKAFEYEKGKHYPKE